MKGDDEFAAFVAARGTALLRTATLLCAGDPVAGEDLLQGALERVLRVWRRGVPDSPEAYARRALVNAAIRRRALRDREVVVEEVPESPDAAADFAEGDDLRRALAALPPRRRAAVVLRYFDDLSEAETARLLGCSVGAVKSSVSRGLAQLRTSEHLEKR